MIIDPESLYLKAPVLFQDALVSLEGWRIRRRRFDSAFMECFQEVVRVGKISNGALNELTTSRLSHFIHQAMASVFWKKRLTEYGIGLGSDGISMISSLPLVSKDEVKNNISTIATDHYNKRKTILCHTSGTTGGGLVFPASRYAEHAQYATWWRYRGWHGITFDTWCGFFGGRSIVHRRQKKPPFWRINRPGRQVLFSIYHLGPKTAEAYIRALLKCKIPWIHGYPSALALLAGYKLEGDLPDIPTLKIITTGAENLLPHQKIAISEAFKVPVREHYGQAEGVANFSECEEGRLHVDEDFSYVEFCPIDGEPGAYRIVGTNWSNEAFPLLRYDTGDIASLSDERCTCGKPGRIVERIDGRKEDYVVLTSGAKVGRMDHIFKDMTAIRAAQLYQPEEGILIMRIVPGEGFAPARDESILIDQTQKRLGKDLEIKIEYFDDLPRTSSGKLRFVVSDIKESKVERNENNPAGS